MPLSRANLGPLLSLSFSSNNDLIKLATAQWKYNRIQCLLWQPQQLFFHWYYVKENSSDIRIKFFPTSRNLQSFLQVHNIIRDLVFRVEAVDEKCFFDFPFSPMRFWVKKLLVFPINFMVGLHYMMSNSVCFCMLFDCILVLISAWREPLLSFPKINLRARFAFTAVDNIFSHVLYAWRFEFAKGIV